MKKTTTVLSLVLVLALIFSGCGKQVEAPTEPTLPRITMPAEPEPTETEPTEPTDTEPAETEPTEPTETEEISELLEVRREGHYIFAQPSFDGGCVQGMPTGIFTIVQTAEDEEGNLWGKLKSGMGWICLTEIAQAKADALPVAVVEAYPQLLKGDNDNFYEVSTEEYSYKVAVFAYEQLQDVQLCLSDLFAEENTEAVVLWEKDSLQPNQSVILQLAFPGDLTTYELRFLDASGEIRIFYIMQSGRNGVIYTMEDQ